ncbi:MAG: hypothetical protein A7316_03360 [Candidatus Altiarchaeales archaeon WOR_SM1_86-2]|nr:MAG: hypothetical protein A7316_03360 [Candidatus Altiarchaeales archaeon WOR_SM1_86-2]
MQVRKSLIELPRKGRTLIVTDIHGKLADFEKYMKIGNEFKDKENHLILTGDMSCSAIMNGVMLPARMPRRKRLLMLMMSLK